MIDSLLNIGLIVMMFWINRPYLSGRAQIFPQLKPIDWDEE